MGFGRLVIFLAFWAGSAVRLSAQRVYITEWKSEADAIVYITDWKSEADLIVYKTNWQSEADDNDGLWYFSEWRTGSKKIYFTRWKSEADIKVYFTKWKSEAGWVDDSNKKLLD